MRNILLSLLGGPSTEGQRAVGGQTGRSSRVICHTIPDHVGVLERKETNSLHQGCIFAGNLFAQVVNSLILKIRILPRKLWNLFLS